MIQCPKCNIPAQNTKCKHFKGSNSNLEKTEKGREELKPLTKKSQSER